MTVKFLAILMFFITLGRAQVPNFEMGQTTQVSCPSSSQVLINDVCVDCRSIFGDCDRCSFRATDSINSLQCDQCSDGLYLLRLPSKNLMTPTNLKLLESVSLCVADCSAFAYNRVNNPNTMTCEFCGETCTQCSPQYGCLQDYRLNRGYKTSLTYPSSSTFFSPTSPSQAFSTSKTCKDARCNVCQNLDSSPSNSTYLQCDTCYLYVNNFEIGKVTNGTLKCDLCNSNKSNCLECDPSIPTDCLSCVTGYFVNSTSKSCIACNKTLTPGCKRCNQTQCLQCDTGYTLTSTGICAPCNLDTVNSYYWLDPVRCSHCLPNDTSTCLYCDRGFLGSKSNPTSCSMRCDEGQFPVVTYQEVNKNQDTVKLQTCRACNSSCLTCSGGGANDCTSCRVSDYLNISSFQAQTGTCAPRLLTVPAKTIEIFVTNIVPKNPQTTLADTSIGTIINPFFDLQYALMRAQEEAVQYGSSVTVDIVIRLFKGDHFMVRSRADTGFVYQYNKYRPNGNLNYNLVIQPLECSYASPSSLDITQICTDSGSTVQIFNKLREQFSIDVPVSLQLLYVKIDSLDSILQQTSSVSASSDTCLNERQSCCRISSSGQSIESVDGSETCHSAMQQYLQTQESQCMANVPRAMFKMRLNDAMDVGAPNKITLTNVEISNVFYPLNSIIGTTPIQGLVFIQGSTFKRLLICGGVVKSYYREVQFPDVRAMSLSDGQRTMITKIRDSTAEMSSYSSYQTPDTAYNYVPIGYKCYAATCLSISIDSSSFSQIPFLQNSLESYRLVSASNGLRHQGFILNLDGFKGSVSVTNSMFNNLQLPISSCALPVPAEKQSLDNYNQLLNSKTSFSLVQVPALFSIFNQAGDIQISNNKFQNNVMQQGLFTIDSKSGTTVISGNTFTQNSAALGQNLFSVRQCNGVTVQNNSFAKNIGCSGTGMVQLQCGVDTDAFTFNKQFNIYTYKEGQSASTGSVSLSNNNYVANFAGTDQHILSVEGFSQVHLNSETFKNNENYLPQSFLAYSPLKYLLAKGELASLTEVTSLEGFDVRAHSIVRVSASTQLMLDTVTFDNNWVSDINSYPDETQSNALTVQDLTGVFSLQTVSFTNNLGSGASLVARIPSNGYRSGLLVFQNVHLDSIVFKNIYFGNNTAFYDKDYVSSVVPCLFTLDRDLLHLSDQAISIINLQLVDNKILNGDFAVKIKLDTVTLDNFVINSNTARSVLKLVYPTQLSSFQLLGGKVYSNVVTGGAVLSVYESPQITFQYGDVLLTQLPISIVNLNVQDVVFTSNQNLPDPLSKTSCIEVFKSATRVYPWLNANLQNCSFINNVGIKTNAFYFDQSMVSSWKMDSVQWKADTATTNGQKQAEIIFSNNPLTSISVTNSSFQCQNSVYVAAKILKFDKTSTEGRPSLFRISGSGLSNPLPFLDPTSGEGTLDQTTFINQFSGNKYTNCNMVSKGAVFYLEKGAQLYDTGSFYQTNSALEGGIAYLSDDATYLYIDNPSDDIGQMRAYYGAIFFATSGATAHLTQNIVIRKCQAYEGVVAFLTERARLVLTDTIQISNNVASKQALISSIYGTQMWLDGVTFQDNIVAFESPIIFMEQSREQFYLVDGSVSVSYGQSNALISFMFNTVVIRTNIQGKGRLLSVIQSALVIDNFVAKENYPVKVDTQGIYISDAEVWITNSEFVGQQSTYLFTTIRYPGLGNIFGSFISVYGRSNLVVDSTTFKNGRANQGGCISLFGDTNATIRNSDFNLCTAMLGGAIYADGFAKLELSTNTFQENIGYQGYGQNIYAIGGTKAFKMDSCSLVSHQNSVYLQSSSIQITNSGFTSDGAVRSAVPLASDPQNGGGLFIQNSLSISIDTCNFEGLSAVNGGAVYITENANEIYAQNQLISSTKNNYLLSLTNLVVQNCSADQNGGAIYLKDTKAAIIHNATITSKANTMGGGIYFYCTPASLQDQITNPLLAKKCGLDLQNTNFVQCTADQGGALFWNFIEPNMGAGESQDLVFGQSETVYFGTNSFQECKAVSYGPQIAAVGQQLIRLNSNFEFLLYYNQSNPKRQTPFRSEDYNFLSSYRYEDVQSGGNVPTTYFALIDKYSQVVQTNQGQKIRFNLDQDPKKDSIEFATRINGIMDFYSMFGVYNVSSMGIFSQPGINIPMSITVQAIDLTIPSVRQYLSTNLKIKTINSTEQYRVVIQLKVRSCIEGEGLSSTGACYTCPYGTFLLEIPTTQTACQVCQTEKSICLGGSQIGPKPGFWRLKNTSYEFLPCKEPSSCLGMNAQMPVLMQGNELGLCDKDNGFSGVLCTSCLPGFKRKGNFQCSKCTKLEAFFVAGSFVLIGIGLQILVKTIIEGAASQNNTYSVFTKILMNHMQMLLIISSFDMAWSKEVLLIFNIAAPIQQITSSLVSFDCWMDTRDYLSVNVYDFYAPVMEFRMVYQKMLIMAVLPILVTVGSYIFWFIVLKFKRKLEDHDTNFIATLVLLLFLVHPSVTQSMINMFDCQNIDGQSRLTVDLQVTCWEGMHSNVAYYIALPCLVVWGVGIPITVFFMMRKDSDKLDTVAVKRKFGFLYNGYKRHNYFWEIVIMYRKVICILIAVFLKKTGIVVQALILLIVLVLFMQGNATNRPFSSRALNDIENLSLSTQIATIYCGIFFISSKDPNQSSFDKSKDFYLTENGKRFFFAVIALCNLAFILLWLTKFIAVIRVLIKEEYPRLYVVLFLCGRSDKMGLETIKRARDVKKESIIESIEAVTLFMTKMKGMYADNVFYQDHNRYLKLLYYIDSERQQIDLTEKRHNYYIQGQIARHRKFDPEVIKEAQDQRSLAVGDGILYSQEAQKPKSLIQRSLMKLGGLFKLQRTQLISKVDIDEEQKQQTKEEPSIKILGGLLGNLRRPNIEALEGKDLLDISSTQLDNTGDGRDKQKKKGQKKNKRKTNQADLEAITTKSRNQLAPLKIEKVERVRANEINQLDGSRILPELPAYLQGFVFDSKADISPQRTQEELKLQTVESFEDRLHLMRKLTARMNEQESPGKSLTKSRTNISQSGVTEAQTQLDLPPESQATGIRDAEVQNILMQDLAVFRDENNFQKVKKKLDFGEDAFKSNVNVVRGGGGQAATQEVKAEREVKERMRPIKGMRHELQGDQVVEVYADKKANTESIGDNDLIITIFDDDGEYGSRDKRTRSGLRRVTDKPVKVQGKSPDVVLQEMRANIQKNREVEQRAEITESLNTDPSMVDFDSNEDNEEYKREQPVATKKYESQKAEVNMGEGLGGLNFHPQITPGLIFDTSRSDSSNNASQQDLQHSQSSGRNSVQIPEIDQFDLNERTRN